MKNNTRRRGSLTRTENAAQKNLTDNRAVIYVRVSTNHQENSVESQEANARRYAEFHQLAVEEVFQDIGQSAYSKKFADRPAAKAMLAHVKKRKINTIIFLRPDRAFRNVLDCCHQVKEFDLLGINVRFADSNIDLSTPEGKLILNVMVMFSEWECNIRAQRVCDGFNQLREDRFARSSTAIPYGWDAGETFTTEAGKHRTRLIPNLTEQKHLTEIITLRKHGHTLRSIATILNNLGVKTKHAGKTITRNGKQITYSGQWTFQAVQSVIEHAELATPAELQLITQ